jgi:hypothetical protein
LVHVPVLTVSVLPSTGLPEITGALVFAGASEATGPTSALVAEALPAEFDAVTVTPIIFPTSAAVSVSVLPVWPSDQR